MKKIQILVISSLLVGGILTSGCSNQMVDSQPAAAVTEAEKEDEISSLPTESQEPETSITDQENGFGTQYPLTIEVKGGDFVTVSQVFEGSPQRVVTANASSIEMLYHMGLKDKIIGTIAIDNAPDPIWADFYESLEVIGDKMTISKEVIAAAEPDRSYDWQECDLCRRNLWQYPGIKQSWHFGLQSKSK